MTHAKKVVLPAHQTLRLQMMLLAIFPPTLHHAILDAIARHNTAHAGRVLHAPTVEATIVAESNGYKIGWVGNQLYWTEDAPINWQPMETFPAAGILCLGVAAIALVSGLVGHCGWGILGSCFLVGIGDVTGIGNLVACLASLSQDDFPLPDA